MHGELCAVTITLMEQMSKYSVNNLKDLIALVSEVVAIVCGKRCEYNMPMCNKDKYVYM